MWSINWCPVSPYMFAWWSGQGCLCWGLADCPMMAFVKRQERPHWLSPSHEHIAAGTHYRSDLWTQDILICMGYTNCLGWFIIVCIQLFKYLFLWKVLLESSNCNYLNCCITSLPDGYNILKGFYDKNDNTYNKNCNIVTIVPHWINGGFCKIFL